MCGEVLGKMVWALDALGFERFYEVKGEAPQVSSVAHAICCIGERMTACSLDKKDKSSADLPQPTVQDILRLSVIHKTSPQSIADTHLKATTSLPPISSQQDLFALFNTNSRRNMLHRLIVTGVISRRPVRRMSWPGTLPVLTITSPQHEALIAGLLAR